METIDILEAYGDDVIGFSEWLMHYGTPRHSGRYPWGSGESPYQRNSTFLKSYHELRKTHNEKEVAELMGFQSTTRLRARVSDAKNYVLKQNMNIVNEMKKDGKSNTEIGKVFGVNESTVRGWLKESAQKNARALQGTIDILKKNVEEKGYLDVGPGTELSMNISRQRLINALNVMREDGYTVQDIYVKQAGNNDKWTTVNTLAKPGTDKKEIYDNLDKIATIEDRSVDGGAEYLTRQNLKYPQALSSDRIFIRYNEEGGVDRDGTIQLRRGVEDISLGNSKYAQVRINVDNTHYLKGMAVYGDDIPDGYDVVFNTNKKVGTPKMDCLKELKRDKATGEVDQDNPFGATIKVGGQREYDGPDGKKHLSVINKVNEEGDWSEWSKTLSSQVLAKQRESLVREQLGIAWQQKLLQYDEIMAIKNPTIKRELLQEYADDCDKSAVHLKAAALPGQAAKVILPVQSLSKNEIYAPHLPDGTTVALIRFPHSGIHEIPELTVNNKNKEARGFMENARDAVGLNSKVAQQLSGADYDGDTVLVIPNNDGRLRTSKSEHISPALKKLQEFDPKESYPEYPGMVRMTKAQKQREMGNVTNLIADMTAKGASGEELAMAARHSMVVIDAEKHHLDWKKSEIDNHIPELKKKWQGGERAGASTIMTRAKSVKYVPERKVGNQAYDPDPETGEKIFNYTGKTKTTKSGKAEPVQQKSTKMYEASTPEEVRKLIGDSNNPIENLYASYAINCKSQANLARKSMIGLKTEKDSEMAKKYSAEVESLNRKLNVALSNAPYERKAQLYAQVTIKAKKAANPDMDSDEEKRMKGQAIAAARTKVGAKKKQIEFTEKEVEAINNNALTDTKIRQILANSDKESLKKAVSGRTSGGLSNAEKSQAKQWYDLGYTLAEISQMLGVSASTIGKVVAPREGEVV